MTRYAKILHLSIIVILGGVIPVAHGEVYVLNDQYYSDAEDTLHIAGEIQNDLDVAVSQVKAHITIYDKEGKATETKVAKSLVNTIMPNMKSPFDLVVSKNLQKNQYSIDVDYEIIPPKKQVIEVESAKMTRDKHDNVIITGTVANNGKITANIVSVVATMYDSKGKVAAVSKVNTEPDYLRANDKMFFLMPVHHIKQDEKITEYSIIAESEEYAAVPEFPLSASILALSVSSYIVITRFSGNITISRILEADSK